jgi:predicted CoA-binding protein
MVDEGARVVVLGASPKPERYSNKAVRLLVEKGYRVIPVHPVAEGIEGLAVSRRLTDIRGEIHTLTLYVSPDKSSALLEEIVGLNPQRVVFNPGTENPDLQAELQSRGIQTQEACTLVLLNTGQF